MAALVLMSCICCKNPNNKVDKLAIAEEFYGILNTSDYAKLSSIVGDSILTKEIDYEKAFSIMDYTELLRWDSVFKPKYKILEIKEEDGKVKARVSKECQRILFLHGEPTVTNETIQFEDGKITSVEITDYVFFDDPKWDSNRTKLLNWIDENHPQLNGFLYDQTVTGALKYIRAIELYKEAH